MTESTGAGDPDRTLRLLWRQSLGEPRGSRGPRQKISVDDVVDAAITLADEDGVEALSIRRVAERLGIGAMSLYTYVGSKAELIDLMIDRVVARIPRGLDPSAPWRARLESMAREEWDHYLEHPWVLHVNTYRPPLGPGISDRYEYQLSAIEGIGLSDLDMDAVITLVTGFVAGAARSRIDSLRARDSGLTDDEWWEANVPVLTEVMEQGRFPISGRVGLAAGEAYNAPGDPLRAFEFGLARVLDGVEAHLARAANPPR
jgi:AcrR family transcriptional regulator